MTLIGPEPDDIPDVDAEGPLDLTGDAKVDAWRGVAAEDVEDLGTGLAGILRSRSRRLLGVLMRPHRRPLSVAAALIVANTLCQLMGPWLVQEGIDSGIPPLLPDGSGSIQPLVTVVVAYVAITLLGAATFNGFLLITGRVGQDMLLDLRRRVFEHFQRLSLSFHERYTSGRVISRQTSDVEAMEQMLTYGVVTLVTSVLLVVGIGIAMLLLDARLALAVIATFPILWFLTRWFRNHSERAYRRRGERDRARDRALRRKSRRDPGGARVPATSPATKRSSTISTARYRDANRWSQRLAAAYGPGVQFIGRITTAVVLIYGGWLVIDGQMSVGVLAAFFLYLRRFFEPMQELSQFYNLFQASAAGLEKLSGVLDEEPTVPEPARPDPAPRRGAWCTSTTCRSRTGEHRPARSRSRHPRGRDHRARRRHRRGQDHDRPARRPLSGTRPTDVVPLDGIDVRVRLAETDLRRAIRDGDAGQLPLQRVRSPTTSGSADPLLHARDRRGRARDRCRTTSSAPLPDGYDTDVTRRARGSPPVNGSSSRSRAPSSPTRPC